MKTLKQTFENLKNLMDKYSLYQTTDEVGVALEELSNLIDEVEKRMECAIRCNREIDEVVFSFVDAFQDRYEETQPLTCNQFEVLFRGIHDIDIALDLKESECIDNDWYGLFVKPKKEPIIGISVDDVVVIAMKLRLNPSIAEIKEVMANYNSVAENEPTTPWELIVEDLLYNIISLEEI